MDHLRILSVSEVQKAKNQREYIKVTFKPVSMFNGKEVVSSAKDRTRLIWGYHKDDQGREFAAEPLFKEYKAGNIKAGDITTGQILRFDTTKYTLLGKERESVTVVVFEGENPVTVGNNALRQNKACVIINGVITDEKVLEASSLVTN